MIVKFIAVVHSSIRTTTNFKNKKTMKNLILKLSISVLVIGLILSSCNKQEEIDNANINSSIEASSLAPGIPMLKITARPYRKTTKRKRDGKNCGCAFCFGVCDFGIGFEIGSANVYVDPIINDGKSRIYFAEQLPNFESEFGIDEDLTIPNEAIENTNINSLIIKEGIYEFHEVSGTIIYDDMTVQTYGFVDVNHVLN